MPASFHQSTCKAREQHPKKQSSANITLGLLSVLSVLLNTFQMLLTTMRKLRWSLTPLLTVSGLTCHMGRAASKGIQGKAPSVAAEVQNSLALCQVAHCQPAIPLVSIEACLLTSAWGHPQLDAIFQHLIASGP